ncbi:MAG: tripartite tricarboxylate transporter substrate-binding protein [Defluviicoccus sp.]|nr:tripartite tricarboxylate transporter substrate-binding protein [Defluviicoccus sp.]
MTRTVTRFGRGAVLAAAALAIAAGSASAQMYDGKTIRIIIPYGPGGTYDKYGQTFSDHLAKHIPGNPTVIVQHMPGAGGGKAMNWFAKAAPKDNAHLIVPLDNSVVNQLMRPEKARYDARQLNWIGSSNQTNMVMVSRTDIGVNSWEDMKKAQMICSTSGKNSTGYLVPKLASSLLGFKIKMVTGYKGSSRSILAVEQGETNCASFNWLAWSSKVPQWFKGDKPFAKAVLQVGIFRDPDLPADVPMLGDLVKDKMDKAVVNFIAVAGILGRGLALHPDASDDAVKTLQMAYDKMNADKGFASDLQRRKLRLMAATGVDIQKAVAQAVTDASPEVVARARKLIYEM